MADSPAGGLGGGTPAGGGATGLGSVPGLGSGTVDHWFHPGLEQIHRQHRLQLAWLVVEGCHLGEHGQLWQQLSVQQSIPPIQVGDDSVLGHWD